MRACYAALRMQESVKRYADGVRRTEGVPIQIRVGLNSGEVVVGAIGNDLKMDYTAVGQTVHLASRMEQMGAMRARRGIRHAISKPIRQEKVGVPIFPARSPCVTRSLKSVVRHRGTRRKPTLLPNCSIGVNGLRRSEAVVTI